MKKSRRISSGMTLMLLLSAIDLLTAALVCGIVLFVVLVGGGEAGQENANSDRLASAPSVVEVVSGADAEVPRILDVKNMMSANTADSETFGSQKLQGTNWRVDTYVLSPGQHQFAIKQLQHPTRVIVHSGSGAVIDLLFGCGKSDQPLFVRFDPPLSVSGSCVPSAPLIPATFSFGMGTRLLVASGYPSGEATWSTSDWNVDKPEANSSGVKSIVLKGKVPSPLVSGTWSILGIF